MKSRFLPLWCVAVLATATAFVVHLAIRFETVRLGYEVGRNPDLVLQSRIGDYSPSKQRRFAKAGGSRPSPAAPSEWRCRSRLASSR